VQRLTSERARDADQIGEMLARVAGAERSRAAAEGRATVADQQAGSLRAEVARLEARCAQLEADAWDLNEQKRHPAPPSSDTVREALPRLTAILDELERREEMAAGLRARTMEQIRQALAELETPGRPAVKPTPVIDVKGDPDTFPTE
jgi:hypothetical protein